MEGTKEIRWILFFLAILVTSISCKFLNLNKSNEDRLIKKLSFEVIMSGSFLPDNNLTKKVNIYYDSLYMVYEVPYYQVEADVWGSVKEDESLSNASDNKKLYGKYVPNRYEEKIVTKLSYFGFFRGDSLGRWYYPLGRTPDGSQSVDSVRKVHGEDMEILKLLKINDEQLIERKIVDGKISEKYVLLNKKDASYADSIFVYYDSKVTNELFSFNRELEKRNAMRISGFLLKFSEGYSNEYSTLLPKRELGVRMLDSVIEEFRYNELSNLFEKFIRNDF